ncbi:CLUMA_CG009221, isoform A [Clunio marinus]|uniref:CLUMA_CG009221, isoform A n=1 Tax=Clunio marinus TaxID=568069 RepID=A0A1J1I864_9DIPT|nr:CLUMA_CG009221, isoform A [Clunio marinus]
MKTLTFVLLAIVIAVDARNVPVQNQDPCASAIVAAMPIWKKAAEMIANLNTECNNELSALSFANVAEFIEFYREFYTIHHCTTSYFSYKQNIIALLAFIVGASVEDYSKYINHQSNRVGDALCLAEGDKSLFNAFTNVADGWNNIIQWENPKLKEEIESYH